MKYELMIHGKPNAGSFNASSGIEPEFADTLNDEFFHSMSSLKGQEVLIVDARFWKGVWYSIYTYWLSNNIRGIDDRDSYIAISVIVPKSYYMFNSGVYERLKDLFKHYVVGTYVSKTGEYLVKDFSQEEQFSKLFSAFGRNFPNLEEDFDNRFNPSNHVSAPICYNPLDCDSKAFVEDLKSAGRVFISETYPTKDQKSGLAEQYRVKLDKANEQVHAQDNEISRLNQKVLSLQQALDDNQQAGNTKYGKLQNEHIALEQKHDVLVERLKNIQVSFESLLEKVQNLSNLLGAKRQNSVQIERQETVHETELDTVKVRKISLRRFFSLPLLNTFLILLFGILLLARFNSNNEGENAGTARDIGGMTKTDSVGDNKQNVYSPEGNNDDTNDGNSENADGANVEHNQEEENNIQESKQETSLKDVGCNLVLKETDGTSSNGSSETLKVLKYSEQKGYNFYFDNIQNATEVKKAIESRNCFLIQKKNPNQKAAIIYRSKDSKKLNPNNIVTLN